MNEIASARLYIELLKRCVGNAIYDDDLDLLSARKVMDPATGTLSSSEGVTADSNAKREGRIWPSRAHTMIGMARLDNLQYCIEEVIRNEIPGDLIETGVWRGGRRYSCAAS